MGHARGSHIKYKVSVIIGGMQYNLAINTFIVGAVLFTQTMLSI